MQLSSLIRRHQLSHLFFLSSHIFPNSVYPTLFYLHPPEPLMFIHLWLTLARLLFDQFVIQPSCIHPLSTPPSPSPSVSDLSRLCEGEGFSVGDGCLKSEENETHKRTQTLIQTHAGIRAHIHKQTHTSSARQWCDGQHWHLAGGTIRWWRRVGEKERVTRWIERGNDGER